MENLKLNQNLLPLITIGIPVNNGENFIEDAIKSVLTQTYEKWEMIISDNASDDQTDKICKKYAEKDKRIRYYRNPNNIGPDANFIKVFEYASGKYFTWLSHDDLLQDGYLEETVNFLESNSDVIVAGCLTRCFYQEDPETYSDINLSNFFPDKKWKDAQLTLFTFPITYDVLIYSTYRTQNLKNLIPDIKNFLAQNTKLSFYLMMLTKLSFVGRISVIPKVLRSYRIHLDSLSYKHPSSWEISTIVFKHKLILLRIVFNAPIPFKRKIQLLLVAFKNFLQFSNNLFNKNEEIKMLRKEILVLRKVCAERLNLINELNAHLRKYQASNTLS